MGLNIASNDNAARIAAALETIAQKQIEPETGDFDPAAAQRLVRHGLGAASYPVGSGFPLTHAVYGAHKFNVIGQDHDQDARGLLEHAMTIQMDDQLADGTPFDAPEALLYCVTQLAPGTYHFTIGTAWSKAAAGSYQFTLTQAVPAGGQLCLSERIADVEPSTWKIKSYASATSTTAIETVDVVTGSTGPNLGDISSATATHAGIKASEIEAGAAYVLNHYHCIGYGYNRWSQSAIRQWLNSAAAANEWWTPQNVFDRPPSYANRPGYLAGFDAALVAVLGEVKHSTVLNTVTDGGTSEEATDKVFLLSRAEVGLGNEHAGQDDGSVYEFWDGATNTDRIKLRDTSAAYWWLRTPNSGSASYVRLVSTSGALSSSYATNASGVAPACVIM